MQIETPRPDEKQRWLPLWRGYLQFYQQDLPERVTNLSWDRFLDEAEPAYLLAAKDGDEWLGFAAIILHRSTWAETYYCYLEDLFVRQEARGQGVARKLIEAAAAFAKARDCERYYWVTQESNKTAQALYDKIAVKSDFIQYVKAI